ncbi:MAG: Gfo/Idh/MocA family protein [Roseicyclus sp.]
MAGRDLILLGAAHVHLDDHLRVADEEGWRVAHVHDRDAGRRARFCERLGAEPLDAPALLAGIAARGVIVCSETVHHAEDIGAALEAGLPVFTEKPLAGSAEAAEDLATRAEAAGTILHTNYFLRSNAGLALVRDRIAAGAIGPVHHARMRFSHDGGFADWLDLHGWMTDPRRACYGGFADEAVHCLDLLGWMLGPVADGAARTGRALGLGTDDHGTAVLRFEGGATGVVEAGWTDMGMRLDIDILGRDGGIRLREGRIARTRRGADGPVETAALSPLDSGEGLRPFLSLLDGSRREPLVTPREAAEVNALLDRMGLRLG